MSQSSKAIVPWFPAARAGSREALEQILEACRGYLHVVAGQNLEPDLKAKAGSSDLVQETLLAACQHFDQFRGTTEAELMAWLRQTMLNKLAKLRRCFRATSKRRLSAEITLAASDSSAGEVDQLTDAGSSPSAQAMRQEDAEAVYLALERLPTEYRQVILLRIDQGLAFEEVGRHMGRSGNAAEKLFARAIRAARKELETEP
jgi:RNA polymerase sigma-70 factor (ECF subfamily)